MISVCILLFASVFVQSFKLNKFTCAKITELHNHHHSTNEIPTTDIKRANKVIQNSAIIALNVAFLSVADIAKATEMAPQDETLSIQKITKVAYLDIKIANYTEESVGTNMGAFGSGRVIIGLYGDDAPMSVQRFLETVQSDGEKLPTYLNSQFSKVSDNCLLQLNDISKLEVINIAGTEQYQYGGDILTDYKPILDTNSIRHDR